MIIKNWIAFPPRVGNGFLRAHDYPNTVTYNVFFPTHHDPLADT